MGELRYEANNPALYPNKAKIIYLPSLFVSFQYEIFQIGLARRLPACLVNQKTTADETKTDGGGGRRVLLLLFWSLKHK